MNGFLRNEKVELIALSFFSGGWGWGGGVEAREEK